MKRLGTTIHGDELRLSRRRLGPARVLAVGGFAAGILGMLGGFLMPRFPSWAPYLLGMANVVMLATNALVSLRGEK